jgi:hypothetical protein
MVKKTTKRSKLEEQGLVLSELGQDKREWGDKLKSNAIINITIAKGLNKSYRINNLVVQPLIGIP